MLGPVTLRATQLELGNRIQSLGSRVKGLKLKGLGFRVEGLRLKVLGFRCFGFRV